MLLFHKCCNPLRAVLLLFSDAVNIPISSGFRLVFLFVNAGVSLVPVEQFATRFQMLRVPFDRFDAPVPFERSLFVLQCSRHHSRLSYRPLVAPLSQMLVPLVRLPALSQVLSSLSSGLLTFFSNALVHFERFAALSHIVQSNISEFPVFGLLLFLKKLYSLSNGLARAAYWLCPTCVISICCSLSHGLVTAWYSFSTVTGDSCSSSNARVHVERFAALAHMLWSLSSAVLIISDAPVPFEILLFL